MIAAKIDKENDVSDKEFSNDNNVLKLPIRISISFLVMGVVAKIVIDFWFYMMGYSDSPEIYFGHFMRFAMLMPFIFVCLVMLFPFLVLLFCLRGGGKYFVHAGLLIAITFLILYVLFFCTMPGYKYTTNGYRDRIEKSGRVEDIRDWLNDTDFASHESYRDGRLMLPSSEWPPAIKELSPHYVFVRETGSVKYARIEHGGTLPGRWGLVVMGQPIAIPLDDSYVYEHRIEICPDAFVFHQLKRKPEDAENEMVKVEASLR